MQTQFGDPVSLEYIEIFSARCFDFADVIDKLQAGIKPPLVKVGAGFVSAGPKMPEPLIRKAVEAHFAGPRPTSMQEKLELELE